jgi:hypothetical protein
MKCAQAAAAARMKGEKMDEWIVICPQAIVGPNTPLYISYEWDHQRLKSREAAIKHGFAIRGSDDFNVASLRGNRLTGFYWMHEDMNDPEGMREIAEQHDFTLARMQQAKGERCDK